MTKKINKKAYFDCPICGVRHKIEKVKGEAICLIQCECGLFIQVKDGQHITSKEGLKQINPINK